MLLREGVPHLDGNFSSGRMLNYLNAELADTLGNTRANSGMLESRFRLNATFVDNSGIFEDSFIIGKMESSCNSMFQHFGVPDKHVLSG